MGSHYVKTVNLKEWWLTKADDNSSGNFPVSVAGIESAGRLAARVFCSALIVERLDLFTLKTEEGVFNHFLIGFPPDWEEWAEKCFQLGVGSEATADSDINPEPITVSKRGNATVKVNHMPGKDSDCNKRPGRTDEAEEVTELDCQDRDTWMNLGSYDSNSGLIEEGVRYHLRSREVHYSEAEGAHRGKHVNNVKGKSSSIKTVIYDDTSSSPLVSSFEAPQTPDTTPILVRSFKEKAEHANFAESGANHAKYMSKISSMPTSGEPLVFCNNKCKINEAQKTQRRDDKEPMPKNAGKDKNLISDHALGGKPPQSKKRKRDERSTQTQKTAENADAFTMSQVIVGLRNSVKSVGVTFCSNNTENPRRTAGRLGSENVKSKKRSTCEDSQVADKLKKSHPSKGKKQSSVTRTTLNNKNIHDSARPILKTGTSKAESKPAVAKRDRRTSLGSKPKLQSRRKLDYDEETPSTPAGGNEIPTSPSSVLRTSKSGRLLLPTMEFWRNQSPVYDPDGGLSAIRDRSSILTVKAQKGKNSRTSKANR